MCEEKEYIGFVVAQDVVPNRQRKLVWKVRVSEGGELKGKKFEVHSRCVELSVGKNVRFKLRFFEIGKGDVKQMAVDVK